MNPQLDVALLRILSVPPSVSDTPLPSGTHKRLELVDVTHEPLPKVPGAISYEATRWQHLQNGSAAVVFATAPGLGRVGVTAYYAGRYVSYRECSPVEAGETTRKLIATGFKRSEWSCV